MERVTRWIQSRWVQAGLAVAAVVLVVIGFGYNRFFREQPAPEFDSEEDSFLFGSVGSEVSDGVPYWVWLVLPRIFPDLLPGPGGYTALGIQSKEGYEMPIGLSRVTVGYPRVGINCAICHAGAGRTRPDDAVARRYMNFLSAAAADPRFTSTTILAEIARNYRLSVADRLLYRLVIIPEARKELLALRDRDEVWNHGAMERVAAVQRAQNYMKR
jgi:hypothetical protein